MDEAGNNKQVDSDILRDEKKTLRALDIVPPFTKRRSESSEEKKEKPAGNAGVIPIESIPYAKQPTEVDSPKLAGKSQRQSDIPEFDLAGEIMAEHRKRTAIKRKSPGQKIVFRTAGQQAEPVSRAVDKTISVVSEREECIAEIVARDIARLCRRGV